MLNEYEKPFVATCEPSVLKTEWYDGYMVACEELNDGDNYGDGPGYRDEPGDSGLIPASIEAQGCICGVPFYACTCGAAVSEERTWG